MEQEEAKELLESNAMNKQASGSFSDSDEQSDSRMESKPLIESESVGTPLYVRHGALRYIYEHRKLIPGYGTVQLLKKSRPYAIYVLFVLLLVYLTNQLDRYTLPIVTTTVGADLGYGDMSCQPEPNVTKAVLREANLPTNFTDVCGNSTLK